MKWLSNLEMEETTLDTKQRTKILSEVPARDLEPWIHRIESVASIHEIKPPQLGLLMMRAVESVEQDVFNVGEVLVCECTVLIDGTLGYGVMVDNDSERVRALAVLDAVFHTDDPKWEKLHTQLEDWLVQKEQEQIQSWHSEFEKIQRSLVNFDLLEEVENDA
jgi:alpha-D-ribose 1-methylphosphonate 5-triphosphate synthase subunit PhnG